jgi:hypothetical protein
VTANAFSQAADRLRRSGDVIDDAAEKAEARIADAVAGRITVGARRAGLRHGATVTTRGSGADRSTTVDLGGPIAHLVVGGTARHRIRPRTRLALRIGSGQRFAEAVQHPGTRGDPFVDRAIAQSAGDIASILDDVGSDVVDELAARLEK